LPIGIGHEADGSIERKAGVIAVAFAGAAAVLKCCGLNGSQPWNLWSKYTNTKLNTLREITLAEYRIQLCSSSSRTPEVQ
jgi:hypothetical protein